MERIERGEKTVSIVIPIYNGEKYIEATMRSILDQSYGNLEVICIIDGTVDRSKEIILTLEDPRIAVLEQENRGAAFTRNRGLSLASGDYILFLDQDDLLMPGYVESTVREMERMKSTGVIVNGYLIDSQGRTIRRMYRFNKPDMLLGKLVKGNQMYTTSQVMLRRETLLQIGGFDENAGTADDWDMWIRQARHGKLVFLDRQLMCYRVHEMNQSRNVDRMLCSELHIVERKLGNIRNRKEIKSYSYMRYSLRAANWKALLEALRLNSALLFNPRFYLAICLIVFMRRKLNIK